MRSYPSMTPTERKSEYDALLSEYERFRSLHLSLNMARGKPGKEQLDLVSDILTVLSDSDDCIDEDLQLFLPFHFPPWSLIPVLFHPPLQ